MSALAQSPPPFFVRTRHKFRKIWSFFYQKVRTSNPLKNLALLVGYLIDAINFCLVMHPDYLKYAFESVANFSGRLRVFIRLKSH